MDDIRFFTTHRRLLAMLETGWLQPVNDRAMICGIGRNICDNRERPMVQEIEVVLGIDGGLLPDVSIMALCTGNTWRSGGGLSFAPIEALRRDGLVGHGERVVADDASRVGVYEAPDHMWTIGFAWPHAIPAYAVQSIRVPDERSAARIGRMASRMPGVGAVDPAIEIGLPAGDRIVRSLPDDGFLTSVKGCAFNAPYRVRRRDAIAGGLAMAAIAVPDHDAMTDAIDDAPWLLNAPLGECYGIPKNRDEYVWAAAIAAERLTPKDIMVAASPDFDGGRFAKQADAHLTNCINGHTHDEQDADKLAPHVGRAVRAALLNATPAAMASWLEKNPCDGVSLTAALMVGMAAGYSGLPSELRGDAARRRDVLFAASLADNGGVSNRKWPARLIGSLDLGLPVPPLGIPQTALALAA